MSFESLPCIKLSSVGSVLGDCFPYTRVSTTLEVDEKIILEHHGESFSY